MQTKFTKSDNFNENMNYYCSLLSIVERVTQSNEHNCHINVRQLSVNSMVDSFTLTALMVPYWCIRYNE